VTPRCRYTDNNNTVDPTATEYQGLELLRIGSEVGFSEHLNVYLGSQNWICWSAHHL